MLNQGTTELAAQPIGQARPSRAARFLARVDRHIPTLTVAKRNAFLREQLATWEREYSEFIADPDSKPVTDPSDPPHAGDYTATIAGLAARLAALKSEAA